MASKGYKRFKNRLEYFRTDNEVAEIVVLNKELLKGNDTIFKRVDALNTHYCQIEKIVPIVEHWL